MKEIKDLAIHDILSNTNWDYTGIIQSRKLFCYRDISKKNKSSILKSIQLRPGIGKRRILKPKEQIKCYDTILSFISCNRGKNLIIVSEWIDDGRVLISNALGGNSISGDSLFTNFGNKNEESLDYTIFSRAPCSNRKDLVIPSILTSDHSTNDESSMQDGGTTSPPRSQLIQIGPSTKSSSAKSSFGSRETYHYTFPIQDQQTKSKKEVQQLSRSPTLRFTRFGECPPWAGFGKTCTLELIANSVPNLASTNNKVLTSNLLSKVLDKKRNDGINKNSANIHNHEYLLNNLIPNPNINKWKEECKSFQSSIINYLQGEDEKDMLQRYNHQYYIRLNKWKRNADFVWDKIRNAVTIHHNM